MIKWILVLAFLLFTLDSSLALSQQERAFAIKAREYLATAKEKVEKQNDLLTDQTQKLNDTQQELQSQGQAIVILQDQIKTSHDNEVSLAKYNAYAKPIIEQVNSWWGIGGILYGFKVLARHLFILALVLVGLGVLLFVLSLVFPAFGAVLRTVGYIIANIIRKIGDLFKRKS